MNTPLRKDEYTIAGFSGTIAWNQIISDTGIN
jgi:hypothetical protein